MINKLKKIDNYSVLLFWIYLDSIMILLESLIPWTFWSYIKYVILIVLLLISYINNKFSISHRLVFLSFMYFITLIINILIVPYRYYVIVEGCTNFLIFIPALYIINEKCFDINKFIVKWKETTLMLWYLIIPILGLYYINVLDYSIFGAFLLPTILILSFSCFIEDKKDIKTLLILLFMVLITLFFGGRMSGITAIGIFIFSLIFVPTMKKSKRKLLLVLLVLSIVLLIIFSKPLVSLLLTFFDFIGMDSRTLKLINNQLISGNIFSNIYLASRENIYLQLLEFVKNNLLLPNGISVTRYLTNGVFYHPHGLLLELLVTFGLPLTIIILLLYIVKIYKFFKQNNKKLSKFLMCLIVFYLIRSVVDTSIFNYFASIMIFALLFLYKKRDMYHLNSVILLLINKVIWFFPKAIAHKIFYFIRTRKVLNLDNPKLFNEKLQYLIVYHNGKKEADLSDKYKVRDYVKKCGYSSILTELYGVYKNINEIDFEKLPKQFVLKANNCSGGVYICTNKEKFNFKKCKKGLNYFMKTNFAKQSLEYHYAMIEPCIICEEYINDFENSLIDYKFYCFDGKCDCVLICSDRDKDLRLDFYDLNWNYLNFSKPEYRSKRKFKKVKNFDKMVEIAERLSKGLPFARIDLYNCDGKIYFGEITFTPYSGVTNKNTDEAQIYFGNKLKLPCNSSLKEKKVTK